MYYTETELAKLIESVEKEFRTDLAKAEAGVEPLNKAEDAPPKKEAKPEEKPEEKEHEAPKEEAKEAVPAPEEGKEAAPAEGEAAPAPEAHQEGAGQGHDYDDEDLEHMHKMYMSMSPGEQRAHHDALRKCMDASMGKQAAPGAEKAPAAPMDKSEAARRNGGKEEEAAPGKVPGAKSEDSKANGDRLDSLKKVEAGKDLNNDPKNGGIEGQAPANAKGPKSEASYTPNKELYDMGKSEDFDLLKSEVEAQKNKAETLQKTLDSVTEFLTKFVQKTSAPQGKAVTSYDVIAKSEGVNETQPMTKSEILGILSKKASDPSLAKSDRDAINEFYLNNASVNSISHLLK